MQDTGSHHLTTIIITVVVVFTTTTIMLLDTGGTELMTPQMLSKCSTSELHLQTFSLLFLFYFKKVSLSGPGWLLTYSKAQAILGFVISLSQSPDQDHI